MPFDPNSSWLYWLTGAIIVSSFAIAWLGIASAHYKRQRFSEKNRNR